MPRANLVAVNLDQFRAGLGEDQRLILAADQGILDRFIVDYQNGNSLLKFLVEDSIGAPPRRLIDHSFDEFIEIAVIFKMLINQLHDVHIAHRLSVMQNDFVLRQHMPLRDFLQEINNVMVAETPFRMRVPRGQIPENTDLDLIDISALRQLCSLGFIIFSLWRSYQMLYIKDDSINLALSFLCLTFGNLAMASNCFLQLPAVIINGITFPPAYHPKAADSPGITAYKEVLRFLHMGLHQDAKEESIALFNGGLQNWLHYRDKQWSNCAAFLPNLFMGIAFSLPICAPKIAFDYESGRNNLKLFIQACDLNSETNNAEYSNEFRNQIINLVNFVCSSYMAYHSDSVREHVNEYLDPTWNEQTHTYARLHASAILGLVAMITCREVTPLAMKAMAYVTPAPVKNMIGQASGVISNQFNYLWHRGLTVIGMQSQQNARPALHRL